ncbi:MAG: Rieske (2Fe-2S) protein [Hydrococcus sp. Prado102]|jgi:nitrite reductase/ring-hydroxylating ferredoxin subunit|nr:Rieske (2Fe-2S) protein [Hydrococcus sp. Prado102]
MTQEASTLQEAGWIAVATVEQIPYGGLLALEVEDLKLIMTRKADRVMCYRNSCTHLELPLDTSKIENGILTCYFHRYRYRLETGECLTVPTKLESYPVKLIGDRVWVKIR